MNKFIQSSNGRDGGFIMVWAIILMIIIFIAILVMVDVNTVARGKVKFQAAADAAALTGAKWQKESLNAIGELNMIKATSVLLDLDVTGETDSAISQMQTRIAFTGPLIGVGAAQQAAKNNGVDYSPTCDALLQRHLAKLDNWAAMANQNASIGRLNDYDWIIPQQQMIYAIMTDKPAVRMEPDFVCAVDDITPTWLLDESLYDAIIMNNFCHPSLSGWFGRDALLPDAYWRNWWTDVQISPYVDPPKESGLLSLGVGFSALNVKDTAMQYAEVQAIANANNLTMRTVPLAKFCMFDTKWYKDFYGNGWNSAWLSTTAKESMLCGGAISKATVVQSIVPTMRYQPKKTTDRLEELDDRYGQKKGMQKYVKELLPNERTGDNQSFLTENSDRMLSITNIAVAKPLGELTQQMTPCAAGIVLPVFNQVTLVPQTMFKVPGGGQDGPSNALILFLLWLSDNGADIDDINTATLPPELPGACLKYLKALQKLSSNDDSEVISYYDTDGRWQSENVNFRDKARKWHDMNNCIKNTHSSSSSSSSGPGSL